MLEILLKESVTYMTYEEYKNIIADGLLEYCRNGGSLVYLALHDLEKECIFSFDKPVTNNEKKWLIKEAYKAIREGKDLPDGIRLEKIIIK